MADAKKIGAKIVIDGEAEFRQSINNSKAALKQFDSELKLTQEQFKGNEKSLEALKKTQETYLKQQSALQKQEKAYVDQLTKAQKTHAEAKKSYDQTAKNIDVLKQSLEKAKNEYGESSDEVKDLSEQLDKAQKEYKDTGTAISNLEVKMSRWEEGLNDTRTSLVQVERNLDSVTGSIDNFDESMEDVADSTEKANPQVEKLGVSMGQLISADLIASGIKRLASGLVDLAEASIDVGMKFSQAMSNVEALSGATGDDLEALTAKAREMGASTRYSASEAADALSYMALAGWNTEQMLEGITPVLSLAAAANMDLAEASDIVTDYLTAFGLEAKDATHFSDVMAKAMSTSNTTVEMLGESYKNCAATCGSMGIAMEDTTAVLATMANAGVKGGEAGTALNAILTRLATNTKDCADVLHSYGVDVYDEVSGNMNSLSSILGGLSDVWGTLTQQEQASLAKTIAGTNQYSEFQTIMIGVSEAAKEGGQSFYDYAESLRNCDGAAEDMAKVMQDNLTGDITILKSALEGLGIASESVFDGMLRESVQTATKAVGRLEDAISHGNLGVSLDHLSESLGRLLEDIIDSAEDGLPKFIDLLTALVDNIDLVGGAVKGAIAGYAAYKVSVLAATVATEGFTVALNLNPIGLIATAIVGAGIALDTYCKHMEEAREETFVITNQTKELAEETKSFNNELQNEIAKRKADEKAADDQRITVHKLIDELYDANTEQARASAILEELNGLYPELNASIDEHGNVLGYTKEQMSKYIEKSMEMAKVEAAKERLVEIGKDLFEAENELTKQEEQLKEQHNELANAEAELSEETSKSDSIMQLFNGALYDARARVDSAKEGLEALTEQNSTTKDSVAELEAEYERTSAYITENEQVLDSSADSLKKVGDQASYTAGELAVMTDEFQEQVQDLQDSIAKTLESSNSIFTETKEVEKQNIGDMKAHVQDHINDIQEWKDSYSQLSERVGDTSGTVLSYLAQMGTEGKGYIDAMLTLDDKELDKFVEQMREALTLPDEVAAEITDSYTESIKNAIDGTTKTASEAAATGSDLREAEKNVADSLIEEIDESWGSEAENVKEKADNAMNGVKTSLEEAAPVIQEDANIVALAVEEPIETTLTYDAFHEMGVQVGQGLEDGIRSKIDDVKAAAQELANAAKSSAQTTLDEHSPSKVFRKIGQYVGEGFELGIEDSMSDVIGTVNNLLPSRNNTEQSASQLSSMASGSMSNGSLSGINALLNQYLPQLSNKQVVLDTGATVGALANPMNKALGRIATRGV